MIKRINLFGKIITPVIVIGIAFSYAGFLYLNTFMEDTINHEIEQKMQNKTEHIYNQMVHEFKLLFYLYGKSFGDYKAQEIISKNEVLLQIKNVTNKTNDIAYIIDPNEFIQLTKRSLLSSELASIIRKDKNEIVIDEVTYKVKQLYFKPWNWRIVYLLNTKSFENILYKNKLVVLSIVYLLLLILVLLIVITFKIYIKKPIDMLLEHFGSISKGKYLTINMKFNTKEIDDLIADVNKMTSSIMYREKEAKDLLNVTKQNEEYMKDVLSSQSSIIVIKDQNQIHDVNESFLKFFYEYKSLNDFKNKHESISDYFVKEEGFIYDFSDKNWIEYLLENSDLLNKVKIFKDNKYYIYTIQAKKSEKYNRTIITMTDITQLEKNTKLLEQYKKAVDAGAIVSKSDLKGKITYVNKQFIQISGYSKEELLGSNHNILRSKNTPSSIFKDMWNTIKNKKIWHGNIENKRKDGEAYFVSATIIPILDENNDIFEYVALRYDITEQVLDKQKAQKAESAKSNFLANMSHEIRTPLNAILGFTKLLTQSELPSKESKYINTINTSANSLLEIINDILDISKIENGSLVYEKIEFNPFNEFEGVINLFMVNANEKSISLVSFIDPLIPKCIIGDPLRVKQVLSNLISNAIKFTPQNGTIFSRIELVDKSDKSCKIKISVQDSGIGISKDKQSSIFEEFSQADNSISREFGGTGLGLSISNKIVQALGSNIELESDLGKGSKFFFELEFDTDHYTDTHMDQFKKLNVVMLNSKHMDLYQYPILKEYLQSLCGVIEIKDSLALDSIDKLDIAFIDEHDIDQNIINKSKDGMNFVVLSKDKVDCEKLLNCTILNYPLNTSALFDILIGLIDHEALIEKSVKNNDQQNFTGSVLIAEDHEINQQLIAALLDIRGIKYTFANNGNEAVELFKKGKYDIIFMDINMPEKNGIEATIEIIDIEKENNLTHTPIVALTANVIEADKQKIMDIGTDDYLYKPIEENKLDDVFKKYLQSNLQDTIEVTYDLDQASDSMGIPSLVVEKIVKNFCSTIDQDLQDLKDAIEKNDFEEIKSASHKIKGASLNLRMDFVAKYAQNIEELSIQKDNTQMSDNFTNLSKAIDAVKESIN